MNGSLSFSFESLYEQEMSVQMYKQRKKQSYGDRMRLNPNPKSPIFSMCCVTKILKATEAREKRKDEREKRKRERGKSKRKPPPPKKKNRNKKKDGKKERPSEKNRNEKI